MIERYISLLFLIITLVLTSCDFGTTNIDPTTLPDVDVNLILPAAEAQTARNLGSIGARVTGTVVQYFEGVDAQTESYSKYLIDENTLNTFWRTGLYSAAMRDCQILIKKSKEVKAPHYSGIAKILLAVNLGITTTFWGDVPFSEAYQENNIRPEYDDQKSIYESIQLLLDEAIVELSLPIEDLFPEKDDLIFEGNFEHWIATARALKARYYLHLIKRNPNAAQDAILALEKGIELSEESVASFPFGNSQNEANPLARFGEERPNQLILGNFIKGFMLNTQDPRITKYGVLKNGEYLLYLREDKNLFWTQFESPLPIISYTELLFIKAECYLRLSDEIKANEFLIQAITSNMRFLGVSALNFQNYLNKIGDLESQVSFENKLRMIIEQKYVALFSQGTIESWVDYRRTGYPALDPFHNASESFNPSKVVPRRYIYPISERNTNDFNLQEAIQHQGGHLLDVDLWAFK